MYTTGNIGLSFHNGIARVYMSNGVASFGTDDAKAFSSPPVLPDFSVTPWSPWGEDNLMPLEMANHIENCGVLNETIDKRARATIGKGPQPCLIVGKDADGKDIYEWITDDEIQEWLELNQIYYTSYDLVYDKLAYGWNVGSYILNKGRNRINRMRRIDVHTARLSKKNRQGLIEDIYTCDDWERAGSTYDTTKQARISLLRPDYELDDLYSRASGVEFAFVNRRLRNGRGYYPFASWWPNREWVKLARNVPVLQNAFFTRAIVAQFKISVSEKYFESVYGDDWGDNDVFSVEERKEKRLAFYKSIDDNLTGKDNAFKSIASGSYYDDHTGKEIPYITIEEIPKTNISKDLLPQASAANMEIHFTVGVNTAVSGAGNSGGPYGSNSQGSNIRESHSQLIMDTEPDRMDIASELKLVANFNGWTKRLQKPGTRLTFRYQSNLLTTLDTGKSTKPEAV